MSLFSAFDDVLVEELILKDTLFQEVELSCFEARFVFDHLPEARKAVGRKIAVVWGLDNKLIIMILLGLASLLSLRRPEFF